jgi:hypothetical protein
LKTGHCHKVASAAFVAGNAAFRVASAAFVAASAALWPGMRHSWSRVPKGLSRVRRIGTLAFSSVEKQKSAHTAAAFCGERTQKGHPFGWPFFYLSSYFQNTKFGVKTRQFSLIILAWKSFVFWVCDFGFEAWGLTNFPHFVVFA